MKYGYINKFTALPGQGNDLLKILLQAAQALETNSDCIQYLISTVSEPEVLYVTEIWTSKEAHDDSLEPVEVKAVIAKAMPLIASISNIAEQRVEGGKGLV